MKFVEYMLHMLSVVLLALAIVFAVRGKSEQSEWELCAVSETVARVIAEHEADRMGGLTVDAAERLDAEYHFVLRGDSKNRILVVAKDGGRVSVRDF